MGAISGIVLLVGLVGITIWLLWSAFRAGHWAWGWRTLAGIVGTFLLLFLLLMVAELISHGIQTRRTLQSTACFANLNNLGKGFLMYKADDNERMPVHNWTDAIAPYAGDRDTYRCPLLDHPYGYTLNELVLGLDCTTVDAVNSVSVFDGPGGKDSVGGTSEIRYRHYDETAIFGFLDGHVRRFNPKDAPPLLPQRRN